MGKVKNIMHSENANSVLDSNSCYRNVLEEMNKKKLGAVSIVDGENKLIGIITDGDVRRTLLKTQVPLPELFLKKATDLMIKSPKTISPEATFVDCLNLLEKYSFWVVPVVDEGTTLLGMVHMHTLLKAMQNE